MLLLYIITCFSYKVHTIIPHYFARKFHIIFYWGVYKRYRVKSTGGLLICTLISENQGLKKLRSISNLRKISGPAHLIFFSVHLSFFFSLSPGFFQVYGINLKKIQVTSRDIHIECSKQFKWNLYFCVSGQSGPFWVVLKLL